MNNNLKYKHLFFDLDHTLWDFDTNAHICLVKMYQDLNLKSEGIPSLDEFITTYNKYNSAVWRRFEKGEITGAELKWKRMWQTILDYKVAKRDLADKMSDYYMEVLPQGSAVYESTYEVLDYLKEKGYQMNILTNGFDNTQRGKLISSHLDGYFEFVVTSDMANSAKPQKDIFEYAMNLAHAEASDSLMLGDNLGTDIAGANVIGMDSVFVNLFKKEVANEATYEIRQLKDLEQIL